MERVLFSVGVPAKLKKIGRRGANCNWMFKGGKAMKKKLRRLIVSTRDAVESAIDLSKEDKSITWEEAANKKLTKITQWESQKNQSHKNHSEEVIP